MTPSPDVTDRWPLPQPSRPAPTAVCFLVRGRDTAYEAGCRRFIDSYRRHAAGLVHDLVVITKGFDDPARQSAAEAEFAGLAARVLRVPDDSFDLGAYREAARALDHERICFLNGYSEILSTDWLLKLALNLDGPGIGLVGCSGSFERLRVHRRFGRFPNVHLRSNAFMLARELFLRAIGDRPIRDKLDAFLIESGPDGITRRVLDAGLGTLIVGADGRGYPPPLWPRSRTFRLGLGDNLLVADNQTRFFEALPWRSRLFLARSTWGRYRYERAHGEVPSARSPG